MKILLDFNSSITKKNSKKLGGIEYKNKKTYFNNKWDVVISSNNARVFNKDKKQKYILWIHNKIQIEKAIRKRQLIPILRNDIHAVFVSKYLERVTSKIYNFKTRNIIPNFLDKKFENLKLNFIRKPMFIWSVQRDKGLSETITVWIKTVQKYNSYAELHVFGIKNFKLYKKLEKYNIFFHGRVDKNILIKFYKKSMAMICLGYDETFCLNAIESMSCGLPVLSFKKTALNDLIKNNINGFKLDNFQDLSKKIIFLINMDREKRIKIINKTYKYSQKFYFKNIRNKWISLISK